MASAEEAATEAHLEYETVKADGQDSIKAAKSKEVLLAADLASLKINVVVSKAAALDALKHTSEGIDKSSKGARAKVLTVAAHCKYRFLLNSCCRPLLQRQQHARPGKTMKY